MAFICHIYFKCSTNTSFLKSCCQCNNPMGKYYYSLFSGNRASQGAQTVKRLPGMLETWVQSLGWEDPLEKVMATHSSILAWKIPWTEEPGRLQSMGSVINWGHFFLNFYELLPSHHSCFISKYLQTLFISQWGKSYCIIHLHHCRSSQSPIIRAQPRAQATHLSSPIPDFPVHTEIWGTRNLAPESRSAEPISAEELTSCGQSTAKWEMETVDKFILFSSLQRDCPEMQLCRGWFFKTEQPGTLGRNELSYTCSSFSFSFPASLLCLSGLSLLRLSGLSLLLLGTVPPNKAEQHISAFSGISLWLFATQWTMACQAPLSMAFSRQEHCSGVPFPSPLKNHT